MKRPGATFVLHLVLLVGATGVYGRVRAAATTSTVAMRRCRPGRLMKNGFRVRTTSTIRHAEMTDSRNQPVLNRSTVAPSRSSTPKVA
jgi:hypothetical protein